MSHQIVLQGHLDRGDICAGDGENRDEIPNRRPRSWENPARLLQSPPLCTGMAPGAWEAPGSRE